MKQEECRTDIIFIIAGLIALIVILATMYITSTGMRESSDWEGEEKIRWTEVYVRKSYTTRSEAIGTLHEGDTVTMTGRRWYVIRPDDAPETSDYWIEIQWKNGETAWIYGASV